MKTLNNKEHYVLNELKFSFEFPSDAIISANVMRESFLPMVNQGVMSGYIDTREGIFAGFWDQYEKKIEDEIYIYTELFNNTLKELSYLKQTCLPDFWAEITDKKLR